ncbi:hypothetical protein ACSS6W_009440 [Trichoderma asperelloides]
MLEKHINKPRDKRKVCNTVDGAAPIAKIGSVCGMQCVRVDSFSAASSRLCRQGSHCNDKKECQPWPAKH